MRQLSDPHIIVRALIIAVLALAGLMTVLWWRVRTDDRQARRDALPACVERLGSAEACEARMDEHHRTCFNYNNKAAGRYTSRVFDSAGYLACIIQGPEPWAAGVRAERETRQRAARSQ